MNTQPWLENFVPYFRALGFFPALTGRDLAGACRWLSGAIVDQWGAPIEELADSVEQADVAALCCDRERVLLVAADGVYPGERAYLELIEGCARVAPQWFRPYDIREHWPGDNAELSFRCGAARYRFVSNGDKYLDAAVVHVVNRALADPDGYFVVSDALGMPSVFIPLRREQVSPLCRVRGWRPWNPC